MEGFSITPPPSFNPGNPPQVDLYTFFGTITLYGTTLTFANTVPDVFVELGFTSGPLGASDSSSSSSSSSSGGGNTNLYATTTTTTRRKLLGIAELVGFFNFLNTASWNSHVASGANSSLPMTNFTPSLPPLLQTFSRTYFPCVSPLCQGVTAVDGSLVAPTVGVRTYQGTLYQFYDENGYSSTDNVTGVTSYVAQRTYEMWPGVTLVELSNGTATKVNYLTANGSNYNYREIPVVSLTNSSNSTNGSTVLLDQNARYTRKVEQTGQSETVSVDVYATTSTAGNLTNQFFYYSAAGDVSIAVLLIAKVSDGTTPLATYSNGYVTGGDVITEFYLYQPLNAIDTSLFSTAGIQASVLAPDTYFTPPDIAAYSVGAVANAPDPAWGTLVPTNYTNSSSTSGRRLLTCSDSSKVAGNLFGSITGTYHCLANTFDISGVTGSSAFTTTPVSLANKPVGASGAGSIGTFDCGYVMGKLGALHLRKPGCALSPDSRLAHAHCRPVQIHCPLRRHRRPPVFLLRVRLRLERELRDDAAGGEELHQHGLLHLQPGAAVLLWRLLEPSPGPPILRSPGQVLQLPPVGAAGRVPPDDDDHVQAGPQLRVRPCDPDQAGESLLRSHQLPHHPGGRRPPPGLDWGHLHRRLHPQHGRLLLLCDPSTPWRRRQHRRLAVHGGLQRLHPALTHHHQLRQRQLAV